MGFRTGFIQVKKGIAEIIIGKLSVLFHTDIIPVDVSKAPTEPVDIGLGKISRDNTWSFIDRLRGAVKIENRKMIRYFEVIMTDSRSAEEELVIKWSKTVADVFDFLVDLVMGSGTKFIISKFICHKVYK